MRFVVLDNFYDRVSPITDGIDVVLFVRKARKLKSYFALLWIAKIFTAVSYHETIYIFRSHFFIFKKIKLKY